MKYLIFLVLLAIGLRSSAQKNKRHFSESIRGSILEINPNGDGFTKTRLPYASTVKFKISNVNSFKIEGTNSIKNESINFDVPAQFSKLIAQPEEGNESAGKAADASSKLANSKLEKTIKDGLLQDRFTDRSGSRIRDLKKIFINNYNGWQKALTTILQNKLK